MSAKRRTAIKTLTALALAAVCGLGFAGQVAGTIVNLSGPLMVRKADGAVRVLGVKSEVEQGDTLHLAAISGDAGRLSISLRWYAKIIFKIYLCAHIERIHRSRRSIGGRVRSRVCSDWHHMCV